MRSMNHWEKPTGTECTASTRSNENLLYFSKIKQKKKTEYLGNSKQDLCSKMLDGEMEIEIVENPMKK